MSLSKLCINVRRKKQNRREKIDVNVVRVGSRLRRVWRGGGMHWREEE